MGVTRAFGLQIVKSVALPQRVRFPGACVWSTEHSVDPEVELEDGEVLLAVEEEEGAGAAADVELATGDDVAEFAALATEVDMLLSMEVALLTIDEAALVALSS